MRSHSQLTELGFDPQQPGSSILNLFLLLLLISGPWVPSPVSRMSSSVSMALPSQ